jgi:NADPH2:quinone reductase
MVSLDIVVALYLFCHSLESGNLKKDSMKAIRIHKTGGPEVLAFDELSMPKPKAGEVLIRHTAIGINFIDIYHRTGLYKLPLPSGIGLEGAGVVEAVGEGATGFKVGDRVAYAGGPLGAYSEYRTIDARWLVKLPDKVSDEIAASIMVKGLTAHYLLYDTFQVEKHHTVLIHAAAGGVGLLMCQWASYLGATVIGTVGSEEKTTLAAQNGCKHVINYSQEDIASRVRELTQGRGVDVVYDSVGKDTFMASLDSLKKFGMMVSYGNASGPVPSFDPLLLSQKGSIYITRPTLMHHIEDEAEYRAGADALLAMMESGKLTVRLGGSYALADAAKAQADLEGRKTTGSLLLKP